MMKLIAFLDRRIAAHRGEDDGAAMVEYALVVAGIALVAMLVIPDVGAAVSDAFSDIADALG